MRLLSYWPYSLGLPLPYMYIPTRNISCTKLKTQDLCHEFRVRHTRVWCEQCHAFRETRHMNVSRPTMTKKFVLHLRRLTIHSESDVLLGPAESGYSPDNTEKVLFGRSLRDLL